MSTVTKDDSNATSTTNTFFHAVGPGKQFPPRNTFRGKPDMLVAQSQQQHIADAMNNVDDDTIVPGDQDLQPNCPERPDSELPKQVNHDNKPSWKVYDAALLMLNERRRMVSTTTGSGSASTTFNNNNNIKMMYHSQWNENNTVLQLHDHISSDESRMDIAHQTFRIAAMTVLRAIEQQQQQQQQAPPPEKATTPTTNVSNDDADNVVTREKDLPESLQQCIYLTNTSTNDDDANHNTKLSTTTFAGLRAYCMERSYENKEYTKRKGGKTEIMTRRPPKILKVKANKDITQQQVSPTTTSATTPSGVVTREVASALPATVGNTNPSTPDIPPTVAAVPLSDPEASSSSPTKPRPTSTVYTTHAILRAAGDLVLDHRFRGGTTKSDTTMSSVDEIPRNNIWMIPAREMAQRTIRTVTKAFQRNQMRYRARIMNAYYDSSTVSDVENMEHDIFSVLYDHPFAFTQQKHDSGDTDEGRDDMKNDDNNEKKDTENTFQPNYNSITYEWQTYCRSHFMSILQENDFGNAVYIDVQWTTRHGRIADVLHTQRTHRPSSILADDNNDDDWYYENFGPHLIVTTENEVQRFAQEFYPWNHPTRIFGRSNDNGLDDDMEDHLYALMYRGSKTQRRHLRKLFSKATGIANASFHVVITSYDDFIEDWLHFCQIPFDTVILDDGVPWLAVKEASSTLGVVWSSAIFSANDQYNGLAGTTNKEWDFSKDYIPEAAMKEAWIGLTAKHRIITGSTLVLSNEKSTDFVPVSNLLEFLTPQFFSDIKDDWDKSKASHDATTLDHFRKLLSQFIAVYNDKSPLPAMSVLSENAVSGALESPDRKDDNIVPILYTWDDFIESGKALQRSVLRWLGPPQTSWIRYALGKANFQHIVDAMKVSQYFGPLCEVITTSSSLTAAGATGQVSGVAAFRLAVRCGRHFGSELGLRQHLLAQHAPSGTWKCRTCAIDCVTSQTRSHHEKLCGQSLNVESLPIEPLSSADTTLNARQIGGVKVNNGRKKQKPGSSGRTNATKDTASIVDHGNDAENVVPALSVINIKDLPPDVKPLLRDPRQTSRTGGNSKRHIYAYRGVCRQARKGHDRWQSQISFAGVNHYLGTFDSEWDAAAIYAWAHLILYGEEATKLAQKEGEEAAAAYEQEQRDIAAGKKLPEPPPKSETKKKTQIRKSTESDKANNAAETAVTPNKSSSVKKPIDKQKAKKQKDNGNGAIPKRVEAVKGKQSIRRDSLSVGNKAQSASSKQSIIDKEAMTLFLTNSVMKAPILGPRVDFFQNADSDLISMAGQRLKMARMASYAGTFPAPGEISSVEEFLRPCIPYNKNAFIAKGSKNQSTNRHVSSAILVGLSASTVRWDLQSFAEESVHELRSEQDIMAALQLLAVEYDDDGVNEKFLSLLHGTICTIGCASKLTQEMYHSLGLGSVPLGGSVGTLDCHIGGVPGSCSDIAACIRYAPNESKSSLFQISCLTALDTVTVNGESITPEMGDVPLFHNDICSVGARVFALVEPN